MKEQSQAVLFQVRLRHYGPVVYAICSQQDLVNTDDMVIVKDEKGLDWGKVISSLFLEEDLPINYEIIRKATLEDKETIKQQDDKIPEVMRIIKDKVEYHNLEINLISAEYTFDGKKLIIYFVADDRVDFRQLVRDLARAFKTRIEMRQIGVRDGARMLGGIGICGRQVCCNLFLKEFRSMSIKMAKDQNLSLNPNKISGICGRLMCCLGYEWEIYRDLLRQLPRQGQILETEYGQGKVVEVDVLKQMVKVEVGEGEDRQYILLNFTNKGERK